MHRRLYGIQVCAVVAVGLTMKLAVVDAQSPAESPESQVLPLALQRLRREAGQLRPLVRTTAVRAFLDATDMLPPIDARKVYRNRAAGLAYSDTQWAGLTKAQRESCTEHDYDETFYYYTGYGCPLIYARPLDVYAQTAGVESFNGIRIFDFGYGSIGHLRLLAASGADVVGVEVEPVFRALYSAPNDQGDIESHAGRPGRLTLVHGQFPADDDVRIAIGKDFDLVISKNVLKRGYIHPQREADERLLVHLGVDDQEFMRAVYAILKPGGYFMVYNIAPAQNPPDEPYIPWADGQFPFARELAEQVGFEIIHWDHEDHESIHAVWHALGLDEESSDEELARHLFAHYTILRRPL